MAYIGQGIKQGTFKVLDTSSNTYNGSNTTFSLGTQVGSAAQLLVSHDGVIQLPGTDYTLASGGASITFSTAPASGASIFITEISGAVGGTVTPSDTSVTADKLNSALLTGHTDIGANIADADLFLTDDGAGGTLRKTAASRLKTYVGAGAGAFSIANLDIDGGTDIGADIADADLFIIDDGAGGTNRKTAASRLKTYIGGGITEIDTWVHTSDVSVSAGNATITSNWSREGQGGFSYLGTGMSQSSGIFTFPSTGFYRIDFGIYYECGGARDRMGGQILVTTNNSSYDERTELANSCSSNGHKVSSLTSAIVDVTDTSNVKVKFNYQASGDATLNGSSSLSKTFVIFTRLADT